MEGRGVLQDLFQNMGQLELANVPIKAWITDILDEVLQDTSYPHLK